MFTSAEPMSGPWSAVGQRAGDGMDSVAHTLAAAEVTGQGSPVLQVGDATLNSDTPRGMRLALSFVHLLVPVSPGRSF